MKHSGGNIMVLGCFAYSETEEYTIKDSTKSSAKYIKNLEACLQSSAHKLEPGSDWMFQQDNDPKHTAKFTRTLFKVNNIKVMKWPKQSPDINPIENLRKLLKNRIHERQPKDLNEVKNYAKEERANNPNKTCQAHVQKYVKRLLTLFDNKGWSAKF